MEISQKIVAFLEYMNFFFITGLSCQDWKIPIWRWSPPYWRRIVQFFKFCWSSQQLVWKFVKRGAGGLTIIWHTSRSFYKLLPFFQFDTRTVSLVLWYLNNHLYFINFFDIFYSLKVNLLTFLYSSFFCLVHVIWTGRRMTKLVLNVKYLLLLFF